MKKILLYTLLMGMPLFTACSDFLDRNPGDALGPSSFWKTEADAKQALTGCYSQFENGSDIMYWDAASDNAYNFHIHEGWRMIGDGSLSEGTPGKEMFNFLGIRACNEYLENEEKITFTTPGMKERYEAEVRCVRAYLYFVRAFNYGDFPFFTTNFITPEESKVPRTAKATIDEFVIKELLECIPMLPGKAAAESGHFSKGAAQALLMRAYLYDKKYDEALAIAKAIEGYSLFNGTYEETFLMKNQQSDEFILNRDYIENTASMDFTPFLPNSAGGWSSVVPTQQLVDAYEMADGRTIEEAKATGDYTDENPYVKRDPRLRATVIYPGQNWNGAIFNSVSPGTGDFGPANNITHTGYNFKKFYADLSEFPQTFQNTSKSIPIFRYAEVLLTIAEAKTELNQIDSELYDAIDKVRERAGMPKVDRTKYNNQAKLRELVRRERRVEFAYEGQRRYDIIRWGVGEQMLNYDHYTCKRGTVTDVVADPATGDVNVKLDKPAERIETRVFNNGHQDLLPIPLTKMDKNPQLVQNPGY